MCTAVENSVDNVENLSKVSDDFGSFLDFSVINEGFSDFFTAEKGNLRHIFDNIKCERHNPDDEKVLRFARVSPDSLKVIILGQDPYPQEGAATGRAFEVSGMRSWTKSIRQSSVRSLLRAIYAANTGKDEPLGVIREKIRDGSFLILPPDKLFDSLENEGVLFLNSYLTCRTGEPLSHKALWRGFSERLVGYISERAPGACWFLWGSDAKSFAPYIKSGKLFMSRHPMLCGSDAPDDFLKNPCFIETSHMVNWTGV